MDLAAITASAVAGGAISIAIAELKQWSGRLSERLIRQASKGIPHLERKRYEEEWLAHLAEVPGDFSKIVFSLGIQIAVWRRAPTVFDVLFCFVVYFPVLVVAQITAGGLRRRGYPISISYDRPRFHGSAGLTIEVELHGYVECSDGVGLPGIGSLCEDGVWEGLRHVVRNIDEILCTIKEYEVQIASWDKLIELGEEQPESNLAFCHGHFSLAELNAELVQLRRSNTPGRLATRLVLEWHEEDQAWRYNSAVLSRRKRVRWDKAWRR